MNPCPPGPLPLLTFLYTQALQNGWFVIIIIQIYKYWVLARNSKLEQSDRSNSIWPNDIIIIWLSWLVFSCVSSQWAHCSVFKYLAFVWCSSWAAHFRNPPPSPAPPVQICYEGIHVCYMGLFMCYMCSSSISYMLTAACCGCIGSSNFLYLLGRSSSSRSIPPRPNTLTLSHILPSQSLRELSWLN